MKKFLIGLVAVVGIVITLFVVFGGQKDILKNMLDSDSIDWTKFTEDELDAFMKKNNAVFEAGVYKCSFLGYDAKLIIYEKKIDGKEENTYYYINHIVLGIPYDTQEKENEIMEALDNYITSELGLNCTGELMGKDYNGVYKNYNLQVHFGESTPGGHVLLDVSGMSE